MNLISFDSLRTLHLSGVRYVKPEHFLRHETEIRAADWVLFPEYWQLNTLHYAWNCRVFPSPATYVLGHDKIEMTRVFRAVVPRNTPDTLIAPNTPYEQERVWEYMDTPFVAKIPRASMGEGVFLINERHQWREYCAQTPVLYAQEYLPIDRDMRIIVAGKQILGGYWRLQSDNGFHNNISQGGIVEHAPLHPAAVELVVNLAQRLNIDHAGFDVAMVGDHPYVFEFNRLFGNQGMPRMDQALAAAIQPYLYDQLSKASGTPADILQAAGVTVLPDIDTAI
ncbi:hypothetical protein NFC81_06165 [Salinispirillum sp. LH 10-3-1]|uniref:ATP-grasp fold RimK-type domain-containing protein n=1 Tax=Salinispirillum sp. LH 10-3-1 TaxID=2952525 RepID=A0AB38YJ90_9GAMM